MAGPKRILIVDDEQDIRTYLCTLLTDQGYDTIPAKDGQEALQKLLESSFDLISLDISMPEKSGLKFYREIKMDERWRDIPVVVVTGVSEDMKTFLSSRHQVPPPEGFVSKPIDQKEMLEAVRSLLK